MHTPHVLPFFLSSSNTDVKKSNIDELTTATKEHIVSKLSSKTITKNNKKSNLNGKGKKPLKFDKTTTLITTRSMNHPAPKCLIEPLVKKTNCVPKLQRIKFISPITGHHLAVPGNMLQVQLVNSTAVPGSNKTEATKLDNTPLLLPKTIPEQNVSTNIVRERLKAVLSKNTVNLQNISKSKVNRKTIEKKKSTRLEQKPVIKITSADRKNEAAVRYR